MQMNGRPKMIHERSPGWSATRPAGVSPATTQGAGTRNTGSHRETCPGNSTPRQTWGPSCQSSLVGNPQDVRELIKKLGGNELDIRCIQ